MLLVIVAGPVWAWADTDRSHRSAPHARALALPPASPGGVNIIYLPQIARSYIPGYVSPFGVAFYYNIDNAAGLAHMQAAGARWASTYFRWAQIEPIPPVADVPTYNWTEFDTKVANASAAGISLYAMFSWNPAWAAVYAGGPVTDTANLLAVAAAAAERYDGDGFQDAPGSPVVKYWAYYMEPDNYWPQAAAAGDRGLWGDDPEGYADMLASIANVVHAANPQAVVLPGGVAYDAFGPPDGDGAFKRDFLGRVIERLNTKPGGATAYIGAVAFHYYPISPQYWSDIHEKTQEIRGILSARGVGHLPLLVPEMGYWSVATTPPMPASSSPEQQARRLAQMYLHGLASGLVQMDWFQIFDGQCCSPLETHGLFFNGDLNTPKPSYYAYQALTQEMTGAYYVGPVNSPGIEGYVFSMWLEKTKWAVWATQPSANMTFPLACVRRVDHLGNVANPIVDNDAGWDQDSVLGQITLQVFENQTIYVEGC